MSKHVKCLHIQYKQCVLNIYTSETKKAHAAK